ncbi:MAG TPA: alpha/beta hydrolase domain-containing protein [Acetobacteraceae bacterium]|nr:alpha/beta hydrolase domain-containing protein [Acetobacteraceae bacterium]
MRDATRNSGFGLVGPLLAGLGCWVGLAPPAQSRITRIEVTAVQSPTFDGVSFGATGPYEKLAGRVYGEVDPADPLNAVITDINLAPRNARGMVEYSGPILILRPMDRSKRNGRLLFEMNNRGGVLALGLLNDAPENKSDPATAADAGNGFVMRQGYTLAWSAWDAVSPVNPVSRGGPFALEVPVARNPDGSDIVGPSLEEFVIDNDTTVTGPLSYPAADLDTKKASLTRRAQVDDEPIAIPADGWRYSADGMVITLLPEGTKFTSGMLYELVYPAKSPKVTGLGFAAVRDLASFWRNAQADDQGRANPLAGDVQQIYTTCVSQPCRYMRDFVRLGFNEDADAPKGASGQRQPRKVFDGVLNYIGGGSGIYLNYRFAQPFRTHRQHIARLYPEFAFPFAYPVLTDTVTGRTDGLLRRCSESQTCPKIIDVNSDNEYWAKDGGLLHTDTQGGDLADVAGVRLYLLSSRPHGDGVPVSGPGICQQARNPLVGNPAMRALLVALDKWVSSGTEPPPSLVPRRSDRTLVRSAQDEVGFPRIPGVKYNGRMHTGDLFDFGPEATHGILTVLPPKLTGSPYPAAVPKADADGNTLPGVRLPEIAAPIATYTGWNLRKNPPEEGCDHSGMYIPFARTKAERMANGDPRPSLEERYPTHAAYVQAVTQAAEGLGRQGLLLEEDVQRYVKAADDSGVGK